MIYSAGAGRKQTRHHTITQQLQSVHTSTRLLYTSSTQHDSPVHKSTGNPRTERPNQTEDTVQTKKKKKTGLDSEKKKTGRLILRLKAKAHAVKNAGILVRKKKKANALICNLPFFFTLNSFCPAVETVRSTRQIVTTARPTHVLTFSYI